jgi:hypothetical protein
MYDTIPSPIPSHFFRLKMIQLAIASRDSNEVVRGWSVDNFCTSFFATGGREFVVVMSSILCCGRALMLTPHTTHTHLSPSSSFYDIHE